MEISPVLGSVLLVIFLANRVSAETAPPAVVSTNTTSIAATPLNTNETTLRHNNNSTNSTTIPITQTTPVPVNGTASTTLPVINKAESNMNPNQATKTSNKTPVEEKMGKTSLSTTVAGSSTQSTSMSTTTLSTTTTTETSTQSMTTATSTSTEAITTTTSATTAAAAAAPTAEKVDNKAVNDPNLNFEQKPPESNPKIIKSETHMEQNGGSSHFFVFACIGLALCIGLYLAYQSRSKLLAFLIEGRRPPRGRSRQSSGSRDRSKVAYRPLNSNATQESTNKGFIY